MTTMADIHYDSHLYSQAELEIATLHQLEDPSTPLPLPSALSIKFVRPFTDIALCEDHIRSNDQRLFNLFAYIDNMITWVDNNHSIPPNIEDLIVFGVPTVHQRYFKAKMRRFRQIRKFLTMEQFERHLLLCGLDHIENMRGQFQEDRAILNLLNEDYRKLRLALNDCLARALNGIDNDDDDDVVAVQPF